MINDFVHVAHAEPHRKRTREILQAHPEIKKLIGQKTSSTAYITVFCVALQITVAYLVKDQAWWVIALAAYCIGAFASHTLFVCIHEAAHNLVFKKVWQNVAIAIVGNFPTLVPTAVSFRNFHLKHHAFQGVHDLDADLPDWYEARLIRNYSIGKAIWLLLFPIFQGIRTLRCTEVKFMDKYTIMNIVAQLAFDAVIIYFMGWYAILYFALSFFFSVGLHPLGARWIQEHYLVLSQEQETYSYYGSLNTVNMNVGYHNEHHDFPSIPWTKLPQLKKAAPEFYDNLLYHTSFVKLLFRFLFSQEISLFSRIVRKERGKVGLDDTSKPDLDLLATQKV